MIKFVNRENPAIGMGLRRWQNIIIFVLVSIMKNVYRNKVIEHSSHLLLVFVKVDEVLVTKYKGRFTTRFRTKGLSRGSSFARVDLGLIFAQTPSD